MNEEEKEAIKTIKSFKNMKWYNHAFDKGVEILTEEERREIDIVINLIEKQQKEIEDLKAITREYESYKVGEGNNIVIASKNWFVDGFFEEYLNKYISKDEIKEKIEEITSYAYTSAEERDCQDYAIQVLKELLGE